MADVSLEEPRLKELFKEAVLEALQERKDLLYDVFAEVIEDLALAKAIKEGELTKSVTREEVLDSL